MIQPPSAPVVSAYYKAAEKMAAQEHQIVQATRAAEASGHSSNAVINAALGFTHNVHKIRKHPTPAFNADLKFGKGLYRAARKYTPIVREKSGKYLLRTTVNGVPVIPPGMTGKQLDEFVEHTSAGIQERHAKTMVFISMSMPKAILKRMFATAWKEKALRNSTVFVLRGWQPTPDGLPVLLSHLVPLFPSVRDQPTVEIDPLQFTGHNVHRVPVVLHQAHDGDWGAIVGDGYGLSAAIRMIERHKGSDTKVFGKTFPIIEPNLITAIDKRAKTYDWQHEEHHAMKTSMPLMSHEFAPGLPESNHALNYLWNPAVASSRTVKLPDGQVVVHAGQHINPLRYYLKINPLADQQRFVVFDPLVHWQLVDAESWVSTYSDVTIMAAPFPKSTQAYRTLVQRFHHPIYAAGPDLLSRIGVSRSPSMVSIQGYRLHVQVPAIPPLSRPAFIQTEKGKS